MSIMLAPHTKKYEEYLSAMQNTGKLRKLPEPATKALLDFSSNDYLCLSKSPALLDAAVSSGREFGTGATGSRLLSGNTPIFTELERKIARDKVAQAALIFSSGFQANISVLSSLLDSKVLQDKPIVFFDKLNHASLYQAVFLVDAQLVRYKHNDMKHLSELLDEYRNIGRSKFIVSETVFGMEGSCAQLEQLASLAREFKAFLYLDEAHATGVFGPHGYGLSTTINLNDIPHLIMGTFSKALGCSGAYVVCSQLLRDYLLNKAQGFIYSTAPSPMLVGAARKAWDVVKSFDAQRAHLRYLGEYLRNRLTELSFNIGYSCTHIVPIIFGKEELAMVAHDKLFQAGIIVSCVRPPTVPPGTSRVRIALNINHNEQAIEKLINVLKTLIF